MGDFHGFMSKNSGSGGSGGSSKRGLMARRDEGEELQEEDVWSFVKGREDSSPEMRNPKKISPTWIPSVPRMIPGCNYNNPTTRNYDSSGVKQSSAPVNIPDWSKIYGKSHLGSRNGSWVDNGNGNGDGYDDEDDGSCDGGDDDGQMVPPHEWLARKSARSKIPSFSMCEGTGRTLKGRDLSKVRNAILTKTGFLE